MARIDELIHNLLGSCKSLGEACADLYFDREDLTVEELKELNNCLFLCDNCGWWYYVGERADLEHPAFCDDNICSYCASEFEDNGYEQY